MTGVKVLVNLEHRGAVGGDLATGDGAGLILVAQRPEAASSSSHSDKMLPWFGLARFSSVAW